MANAYEVYIDRFLEKAPIANLSADKRTCDPSQLFPSHLFPGSRTFWDSWAKHFEMPDSLVKQLERACQEPVNLAPFLALDPASDQEASDVLVLLRRHYSELATTANDSVRFSFSPIASDPDGTHFFYAGFDRGSLWAGGGMCVLGKDGSMNYRRIWVS
jgi:hypothetical protein